jgi:hypothetical protein
MYEALKEALTSDGTPFVTISDANITAGQLLFTDGSPRYPIVISLASEAIRDDEIAPLRAYVNAGGFLFVGGSSFTRNPNGTTRGNFALANEMGLSMANASLQNWYLNSTFTKLVDNRLVSHIPTGSLTWRLPLMADEIAFGTTPNHTINWESFAWNVSASDAQVLANGSQGPVLTTKSYGEGRFVYYGPLQPLIGHGGYDTGMFSYVIFRRAIEWAFENAELPIIKKSPWQYPYDAAMNARHDLENYFDRIQNIDTLAQSEFNNGIKGDYYFCTGVIRVGSPDTRLNDTRKQETITSLQHAVSVYGATIGSHNGGLVNPRNTSLAPTDYDYFHWGPDESLDTFPYGYPNGSVYAQTSISMTYSDIGGWFLGLDNGLTGCGTGNTCPRIWVSPSYNATREGSYNILQQLGVKTTGDGKLGPFPHWTVSTQVAAKRFPFVTLPLSEWYRDTDNIIIASLDDHTTTSMHAAVDFYHSLGALINIYGHGSSADLPYAIYAAGKSRTWVTNAAGVYTWWLARSQANVTQTYEKIGKVHYARASVTGATDPDTAVEFSLPLMTSGGIGDIVVLVNGVYANPADYRQTSYGVKVKVGNTPSNVEVRYTMLTNWVQTDWSGGSGQAVWSDETRYASATGIDDTTTGQLLLSIVSGNTELFADNMTRSTPPTPVPFTWIVPVVGSPNTNHGIFNTNGGVLNTGLDVANNSGWAYTNTVTIDNHSIEADVRFDDASVFGGGISARFNPTTGARYTAWVTQHPSQGEVRIIRFNSWTDYAERVYFGPSFGKGWHHLKMVLNGDRIQLFFDNSTTPLLDWTDTGTSILSGYAGVELWNTTTGGPIFNNYEARTLANNLIWTDDFGSDLTNPLSPWLVQQGLWSITGGTLQSQTAPGESYAYVFYNDNTWANYSVEGRLQFPAGAFGGGISGRLNPATGTRYSAWIYPDGSAGGSNVLRLLKFSSWTGWDTLQQVNLSSVGTGWHSIKLSFQGNQIRVLYDGNQRIDVTDNSSPYTSGGISIDMATAETNYIMSVDDILVRSQPQYGSVGTLLSSAFDGGTGVRWKNIYWDATINDSSNMRIRTRTADQVDQLESATWSEYYSASGSAITSTNRRWIQYQVELTSGSTPIVNEIKISYLPSGIPTSVRIISFSAHLSNEIGENLFIAFGIGGLLLVCVSAFLAQRIRYTKRSIVK